MATKLVHFKDALPSYRITRVEWQQLLDSYHMAIADAQANEDRATVVELSRKLQELEAFGNNGAVIVR